MSSSIHIIEIDSIEGLEVLEQLNSHLKGNLTSQWGEHTLEFDNELGKGLIRTIAFDWGLSLLDFQVNFNEETKIIFHIEKSNPIEFVFVSEGKLKYTNNVHDKPLTLECYQNIILSPKKFSKKTYIFPNGIKVKVNFIHVLRDEYNKKNNNNLSYLSKSLLSSFNQVDGTPQDNHFGNFNLKIADHIKKLNESYESGIIRTLSIEGQINLIMALQLLEQENHENGLVLPESLSKEDIKKIHTLSEYIINNISEPLSVSILASHASISPRKLQLGFNILFSKSVNEYIREIKLEISRDYIKNSDYSISEIVYLIGLRSRSYFSKIFFERYGVLPMVYRKKNKQTTH